MVVYPAYPEIYWQNIEIIYSAVVYATLSIPISILAVNLFRIIKRLGKYNFLEGGK